MTYRTLLVTAALSAAAILPASASAADSAVFNGKANAQINAGIGYIACSGTLDCLRSSTKLMTTSSTLTRYVTKLLMAHQTPRCLAAVRRFNNADVHLLGSLQTWHASGMSAALKDYAEDDEVTFAKTFAAVKIAC